MLVRTMLRVIKHVAVPLAVPLIGTLACFVSVSAHAAKVEPAKPALQSAMLSTAGVRLKLDYSRIDQALAEQECDDDGLVLAGAAPAYPASGPVPLVAANATSTANAAKDAPSPAVNAQSAQPAQTWEIVPTDKTLNAALARWAAHAGWQLVWELPVDYAVEARTVVPGTFEEAVGTVARSMESAEIPLKAIFYSGNKVLRIVTKGVE